MYTHISRCRNAGWCDAQESKTPFSARAGFQVSSIDHILHHHAVVAHHRPTTDSRMRIYAERIRLWEISDTSIQAKRSCSEESKCGWILHISGDQHGRTFALLN